MLPTEIPHREIEEYLFLMTQRSSSPSLSYFKFAVYSLRFLYKMEGRRDLYLELPKIKQDKKLPVVLSKEEMKRMLEVTTLQKHRVLLLLLYGCGLRCMEARNIQLSDIDVDRKTIHIRNGKGGKDRYVPMSEILIEELLRYRKNQRPKIWLFNGRPDGRKGGDFENTYSNRGVYWVIRHACKKADITKHVTIHTLRHTFATHLLEDGLDIVTIKELLGHSKIETTMIYLHVAKTGRGQGFSPLDTLFGLREPEFKHGICPFFINSVKANGTATLPESITVMIEESRKPQLELVE
ncbi:tyrosine-type recombinase/integrase [Flavobacterium silvaticum]|uniref:Tyrosine-type recombinase/integrase n=1 Tax=Flavobacterium silvaticum TaxID=1852020 RepID=A0A972FVY6_9FLAO|nr:tyrosine-type recombinase/integrase [Flavobacterium silvaticum]NMH28625.1 tyrosine-type recombinase/integrase [Flavobacterium silvaticum]